MPETSLADSQQRLRIALSSDFINREGKLVSPGVGLSLLEGFARLPYEFGGQHVASLLSES